MKFWAKKPIKTLTVKEILHTYAALWYPGPCSAGWPFDSSCDFEGEFYFEQVVQPDLWGNLQLLLNMLTREEEFLAPHGNKANFRHHISNYLAAICRLAPDEFYKQIRPSLDNAHLCPTLIWSIAQNDEMQHLLQRIRTDFTSDYIEVHKEIDSYLN